MGTVQTLSTPSKEVLGQKAATQTAQTSLSSSVEAIGTAASLLLLPHI